MVVCGSHFLIVVCVPVLVLLLSVVSVMGEHRNDTVTLTVLRSERMGVQ